MGHIIHYLYTKSTEVLGIDGIVSTYIAAGYQYGVPDLQVAILEKIRYFRAQGSRSLADGFFHACVRVYELVEVGKDFRAAFRSAAERIFASSLATEDWAKRLATLLTRGGAMACDIFDAQQNGLQDAAKAASLSNRRLQKLNANDLKDNEYVKSLKVNLSTTSASVTRFRKHHQANHQGCNGVT